MKRRLNDGRLLVGILEEVKVISKGAEKAPEEPKAEPKPKAKPKKKKSTKK